MFPASTEFGKRIPKQKFYENLDVSPALRRVFIDQIRLVYWRNKLAASTLNIAAGEAVTEIEVLEIRLNGPQLDEAVLKQIDKEIPYHILFILTCDGKAQAWIGHKSAAASGSSGTAASIAASTQHAASAFFGQRIGSARTSVFFSLSAVSSR